MSSNQTVNRQPVLVICGPTASGKTSLALNYAKTLAQSGQSAEIVSADSMQVFKYFDIGTAKATASERSMVRHHMIDICEPDEYFSVAQYKKQAVACIRDIQARDRLAIVCGGTGQYLSALIEGINYAEVPVEHALRQELNLRADQEGTDKLLKELHQHDPLIANRLSPADRKRIIRGLEIIYTTGQTPTQMNHLSRLKGPDFLYISFCLYLERTELYDRINRRVTEMFEQGWVDEVRNLLNRGVQAECTSMQAIGYRQIVKYLDGQFSLDHCIGTIQQATRRYAKRQLTWFRGMKQLDWLDAAKPQECMRRIDAGLI